MCQRQPAEGQKLMDRPLSPADLTWCWLCVSSWRCTTRSSDTRSSGSNSWDGSPALRLTWGRVWGSVSTSNCNISPGTDAWRTSWRDWGSASTRQVLGQNNYKYKVCKNTFQSNISYSELQFPLAMFLCISWISKVTPLGWTAHLVLCHRQAMQQQLSNH